MWVLETIRENLERISPQCPGCLRRIDELPHEKAVRIAAYLWEGCFQSTNDVWITVCNGLLYEIPLEWFQAHVMEVLDSAAVNWNDDFEFYNLCAVFYHAPEVLVQVLDCAGQRIPEDHADEWLSDAREMMGTWEHFQMITENYERIRNLESAVWHWE